MLECMRKHLIITGAVVAALVAAGGVVGYRTYKAQASTDAACASITAQIEKRGSIIDLDGTHPAIAIVGDSYTSGDELDDYTDAWPYMLAKATGQRVALDGIGMTGFVNGGYCGDQSFATRLDRVLATSPDVLIIQGGLNDATDDAATLAKAATRLIARTADVPRVVMVGPMDVPGRTGEATADATLKAVAAENHVRYISTLHWSIPLQADQVHPTKAGAAKYAELLSKSLAN